MAYKDFEGFNQGHGEATQGTVLTVSGDTLELPDESYIRDADIIRDGMDLVLDGPHGQITIQDYFAAESAPNLIAPGGATLTPELVESFSKSTPEYAKNLSMNDASPIGAVDEISGDATVTRTDGTTEPISIGSPIYQGDVIETSKASAVNITFSDESSFAVSEDTRLAVDEYVFDPASEAGAQNFSVLKGVFVFTSGLIGRDDPDDVQIDTPAGSIGIRGTIIAGDVNQGEITVVEGAIVLRDPSGFEMTLASQFETGKFLSGGQGIQNLGQLSANDVSQRFSVVSKVAPTLFSSVNDAAAESAPAQTPDAKGETQQQQQQAPADEQKSFDAEGAADQNGDAKVDGTVDDAPAEAAPKEAAPKDTVEGKATQPAAEKVLAQPVEAPTQIQTQPQIQMQAPTIGLKAPAPMGATKGLNAGVNTLQITKSSTLLADSINKTLEPVKVLATTTTTTQTDPNVLNNTTTNNGGTTTTTSTNNAPFSVLPDTLGIPADYFKASATNHWHFEFRDVFKDQDLASANGDTLTFQLSAQTVGILNGTTLTNGGVNLTSLLDLSQGGGDGWEFNATTGILDLFFNGNLSPSAWTQSGLTPTTDFTIGVTVRDAAGASVSDIFGFDLLGNPTIASASINASGNVFTGNTPLTSSISGTGGTIFTGDGNDTITFLSGSSNNKLYTGEGNDVVNLGGGTTNARVLSGYGDDTINLNQVDNSEIFGMEGNDTFVLSSTQLTLMSTYTNILLDGGQSPINIAGGQGDKLVFQGGGSINFDALAGQGHAFKNFEFLKTQNGATNLVTLDYQDVLSMTDNRKTLVLDMDANDTLNFDREGHGDNAPDGTETINGESYNVYHFDDVTLLVSADTTNVTVSSSV